MKVVLDINIIFSAILSPKGSIADLLINYYNLFTYYTPNFTHYELNNHRDKLINISGYSTSELEFVPRQIFSRIQLIDTNNINHITKQQAVKIVQNIDKHDPPFIALSLELKAPLWTGDKVLRKGLNQKGINITLSTNEIKRLRDN